MLQNRVNSYARIEFKREVHQWIGEDILRPREEERNDMLFLMTVIHPTKNKVRQVVDFHELNEHVSCHMSDCSICFCNSCFVFEVPVAFWLIGFPR